MRRRFFLTGLAATAAGAAFAQPAPLLDALTQRDASRGVREALGLAAINTAARLGQPGAFFADARVRIALPGALGRTQASLARIGLSGPLDELQESLNHAAEACMPQAGRLFASAVRDLTLADAISIVRGPPDAATTYLRGRTEARLARLLRPHMNRALTDSGAFALLSRVSSELGLGREARAYRGEIADFATAKALDGAFLYLAEEEAAIRRDPLRRTSDILRRVFGAV